MTCSCGWHVAAGKLYISPLFIMTFIHEMFQNWTIKEFAIVSGLVGQLLVQTSVIVWWGAKLNNTVEQVVAELAQVRQQQVVSDERQMELRIRLAVQEALSRNAGNQTEGGG